MVEQQPSKLRTIQQFHHIAVKHAARNPFEIKHGPLFCKREVATGAGQ